MVDPAKVTQYLLNLSHPDGGSKAEFFVRAGYRWSAWQVLAADLVAHGRSQPMKAGTIGEFGHKFVVEGALVVPSGRAFLLRSIWHQRHENSTVRLVTAYPVVGRR